MPNFRQTKQSVNRLSRDTKNLIVNDFLLKHFMLSFIHLIYRILFYRFVLFYYKSCIQIKELFSGFV